jgi:hypothetical protein
MKQKKRFITRQEIVGLIKQFWCDREIFESRIATVKTAHRLQVTTFGGGE